MFVSLTAVVVDADAAQRQNIAQALSACGVGLAEQLDDLARLPALLGRAKPPRIVIVNLGSDPRDVLRRIDAHARKFPAVRFVAIARDASAETVMDAMDAGVTAFLPLPIEQARLTAALDRLAGTGNLARRAKVIQFVPTIGGCGATTIACGVAASLARLGKTLLVDLDLVRGAVANSFDVRPRHSIADVTGAGISLDKAKLDGTVSIHRESGLAVLARPDAPADAQRVTREGFERLIDVAGCTFDFVVIDSAMAFDTVHAAAARAADVNVVVMQLTVPSAKNAERFLHAIRRMGIDAGTAQLLINRYVPAETDIQPSEIERALGLKIAWTLPNDFAAAMGAINFGQPVVGRAPRSELSKGIVSFAQMLAARG